MDRRSPVPVRAEVSGALQVFDAAPDLELVPGYGACMITSGGTLADEALEQIAREFLTSVREASPVDGVYFRLHGAMAAESQSDPEGYLLAETRKIPGEKIPIVVSLDLHGIPTDRMFELSDAIVAFHTFSHVDFFETGQRAARLLLTILRGEARPVAARVAISALVKAAIGVLEPLLLGENALEPERVSEKLHQNTFWLGRGGTITHTISGIDIALWDLLGQATGQPADG